MARIAHDPPKDTPQVATSGAPLGDDYLAKIVKLIPAEVVAAYTAIFNLVQTLPQPWHPTSQWINVIFFWAATPIVLLLIGKKEGRPPSAAHLIISTIAFGIWAYAISGDVVLGPPAFQHALAGIALVMFTFLSGLVPLS